MNIIDISSDTLNVAVYPGDPEPRLHALQRIDNDDEFNLTALYACLHTGTHVILHPYDYIRGLAWLNESGDIYAE